MPEHSCQKLMWSTDSWNPPKCGKKAKYTVKLHKVFYFCGIHAKRYPEAKPIQQEDGDE